MNVLNIRSLSSDNRALQKIAFAMLLAVGITTGLAATNTQPAKAGVSIAVGIGGGYAPGYHWYRWHDGYGWHRRWVPLAWAGPVVYYPPAPAYRPYPVRVVYGRPYYGPRYDGWYGYAHPGFRR